MGHRRIRKPGQVTAIAVGRRQAAQGSDDLLPSFGAAQARQEEVGGGGPHRRGAKDGAAKGLAPRALPGEDERKGVCHRLRMVNCRQAPAELFGCRSLGALQRKVSSRSSLTARRSASLSCRHEEPMETWRILIVDDEFEIRDVVAEYLEGLGHDVVVVGSGAEALELLDKGPAPFDLALVDWQMPGIHGRDVILKLGSTMKASAVLIITGHHSDNLGRLTPHVRTSIIHKPFSLGELRDRMRALIG